MHDSSSSGFHWLYLPFLLETDASKDGLGAVLSQKQVDGWYHPATYGSRALTPHERKYHLTKFEFLALKWAVTEHFKEYLLCQPFLVKVDNNPLTYIMRTPNLNATRHQWVGPLCGSNLSWNTRKDMITLWQLCWAKSPLDWTQTWWDSILNGVALGAVHWAKVHNPTVGEHDFSLEWEVCVTTGCALVQMHITDWAKAQREDPMVSAVLDWLKAQKETDLKVLLAEHTASKEGELILQNWQNFMIHQGALYLKSMPIGETEDLLLFVVPKAYCVTTLNGCHWDAGHQGHDCTLSLLWECFWWPGMTNQMQQSIKSCMHCLQHESNLPQAPLHPIVGTAPVDLLHIDFTSIETTMELKKLPRVANILVFQDHFTKHVLVYVTPNQTAKTIGKFLYQHYNSIFGAPATLLSDQGTNFMRSIINELCKVLSVKKLWTMPYHPQTNGLVERLHQTIMRMIWELGEDKKAFWPGHLAEIVHAYNATQSAVTRYSPHYLMFEQRPRLPVDFYLPTLQRPPWEAPPPSMWMNMWQWSVTNWGLPSRKPRPSQWQKPSDRNGTMTKR